MFSLIFSDGPVSEPHFLTLYCLLIGQPPQISAAIHSRVMKLLIYIYIYSVIQKDGLTS